jgi:CDP-glucose 4,6-dehydratase
MHFESIYKNKKVFVTGHTGFKGSWLISWLHLLGAEIKGYALSPENDSDLYNQVKGDSICNSVISDIRDAERLKSEILLFQPDFIFHLAAQPLVRLSYEIPLDTFSVNAIGTANLLEALRWLERPCVVVLITTDKVYHNEEREYYYKETDRLGGYDPYSASKAAAEIIIDSYRNSFFNPAQYARHQKSIAVARAGNVIGGGDWAKDRIIPDIVKALSANEMIMVRNPAAVRPWQHVLEPLSGYLLLAKKQAEDPVAYAGAYNFGPHPADNLSVQQIVSAAIKIWGKGDYHQPIQADALHEAGLLQLDIDKAITELGWGPKYKAHTAIEKTLEWYRVFADDVNLIAAFTFNQIKDYTASQS